MSAIWRRGAVAVVLLLSASFSSGCVRQSLIIKSDPPEALVYLNDQLLGKTPLTHDFAWYGWHRVMVRKEGYAPVNEKKLLRAPVYLWIPFDLVMELLPFPIRDTREWQYTLSPMPALAAPVAPDVATVTLETPAPPAPARVPRMTDRPVLSIDASKSAPSEEEPDAPTR